MKCVLLIAFSSYSLTLQGASSFIGGGAAGGSHPLLVDEWSSTLLENGAERYEGQLQDILKEP